MNENQNVFTAKTVDEAIELGLKELNITLDEAEVVILEEGRKKLFGSVKAKVQISKKRSEGKRACEFIDGLLEILGIQSVSEVVSEEESIKIDIKTTSSARVIGKRGDVLDAIQCMAGAVANIGREEYKKVVVDCENYRAQREETLKNLAQKLAKTAVETGRKMSLEPMSPYERRIIHSALMDNDQVKTVSEGREPARYIVVIPNNAKPYDRGVRYGEKRGGRDGGRHGRNNRDGKKFDRRGGRGDRKPSGGAKRGKKEIYFGTYLGNSNSVNKEENTTPVTEAENNEE